MINCGGQSYFKRGDVKMPKMPKNAVDRQSIREQGLVDFTKFVVGTAMIDRTNENMIEGK
jgi:hypothetical protein